MRYYFIKDQVETGDVVIGHFPTEEMLGDHFTKPLQGALVRKCRAEIMNITYELDMGEICVNHITRLILDSHRSVLGIVAGQEVKTVLQSDQILEHVKVCKMPLNWIMERGHGRLGVMLTSLGKM